MLKFKHFSLVKLIFFVLTIQFIGNLESFAQARESFDTTSFVTTWNTSNPGISDDNTIALNTDKNYEYDYDVDWDNDGVFDDFNITTDITHRYKKPGVKTIRIQGDFPRLFFAESPAFILGDRLKILSIDQWGDIQWLDMRYAFNFCQNLTINAIDAPELYFLDDLSYMFANVTSPIGDIGHWDVSSITNMEGMFLNATLFNADISLWNTSSVLNMSSMFKGTKIFNQEIGNWDVSAVQNMSYMFANSLSFNGNINNWNVYFVNDMTGMFAGSASFSYNLRAWNAYPGVNTSYLFNYGPGSIFLEVFIEVLVCGLLYSF